MRYEVCNWIFGDEDPATTAASPVELDFGGTLPAAYPMSTSEADPASAILDAGRASFCYRILDRISRGSYLTLNP